MDTINGGLAVILWVVGAVLVFGLVLALPSVVRDWNRRDRLTERERDELGWPAFFVAGLYTVLGVWIVWQGATYLLGS